IELISDAEAQCYAVAVGVQAYPRRSFEYWSVRHAEVNYWRQIMRGVMQSKAVAVTQSAIKFRTHAEIFTAEAASVGTGQQRQRTAYANGIAKFPGLCFQVLFGNQVF